MRRLFVAVDPPMVAVAHLGAVVDALEVSRANTPGMSTRLAARDRWHVTLAFLGDVPVRRIGKAVRAIELSVAGHGGTGDGSPPADPLDAPPAGPPDVCFAGGGTFGRGASAILWVGLGGDVGSLRRLADAVRGELRRAHLPYDEKMFRPHLTISRPGRRVPPELIDADVASLTSYTGPSWTVDAVSLYASEIVHTETGPSPRYTRLATAPMVA